MVLFSCWERYLYSSILPYGPREPISGERIKADVTPEPIMRIAIGFMASKRLFAASAIGPSENLADGPATVDELAVKCGVPYRTLRISVDAKASLGLLERDGIAIGTARLPPPISAVVREPNGRRFR
jgi:Dimerisation domain